MAETSVASTSSDNHPPKDLLYGNEKKEYLEICVPLYEATLTGDWDAAKRILEKNSGVVRKSITKNLDTALHIAASTKHTNFVEELVKIMDPEDLELQNMNNNTALCLAAASGNRDIAEIMVKKNENLLMIRGSQEMTPLYMAALFGHKSMVDYFYGESGHLRGEVWTDDDRVSIVRACVEAEFYDVALKILKNGPEKARANYWEALHVLARKHCAFTEEIQRVNHRFIDPRKQSNKKTQAIEIVSTIWKVVAKLEDREISDIIRGNCVEKDCPDCAGKESRRCNLQGCKNGRVRTWPYRLLFVATELGNIRFVKELIRIYPDLIWMTDDDKRTIFHTAVLHRQESIYNLLYEIGSIQDLITQRDVQGNTMLHFAAMKPKQNRHDMGTRAAFQVQQELLWFEIVENMMPPSYREMKNREGKTPSELFTEQHKDLVSKGEEWMKKTASQCMVVAALIATIVFGAAFTLPGGNDQRLGTPLFLHKSSFIVFIISDAISLFCSSMSILVFLNISITRYAEHDFKESLPNTLTFGLTMLFYSIVTMIIAFSSSFFAVYGHGLLWVPILITVFAAAITVYFAAPVLLLAGMKYDPFAEVINLFYEVHDRQTTIGGIVDSFLLGVRTKLAKQNTTSDAQQGMQQV